MEGTLVYLGGMAAEKEYLRLFEVKETGIRKEINTPRKNGRPNGDGKACWYHPKDKETHGTYKAAYDSAVKLGLLEDKK